jgi:hypothetical protein
MYKVVTGLVIVLMCVQPAPSDTTEPFKEPATGIVFPAKLGKWNRGEDHTYRPGLGVSIAYRSEEGVTATVFVYNLNLGNIPAGTASKAVKDQFKQAQGDIAGAAKQRGGSAALRTEDEISLGAGPQSPRALRAVFTLTEMDGNDLTAHVYLTGYKNQFLKIRATYPGKNEKASEPAIKQLLNDLGGLLKE